MPGDSELLKPLEPTSISKSKRCLRDWIWSPSSAADGDVDADLLQRALIDAGQALLVLRGGQDFEAEAACPAGSSITPSWTV